LWAISPIVFFHYENVLNCEKIVFITANLNQNDELCSMFGELPLGFVQHRTPAHAAAKSQRSKAQRGGTSGVQPSVCEKTHNKNAFIMNSVIE
jgi:hypothetical protein